MADMAGCPVCGSDRRHELLHLRSIPTNNVVLFDDPAEARAWPRGSFRLAQCLACGFVTNADFRPELVEYSSRTEETQAFSPHFVGYATALAQDWVQRHGLTGATVLEVGCGKAEFLALMCRAGVGAAIGYDPATHLDRLEADVARRVTLVPQLFGEQELGLDADALVCRHTLEHIDAVSDFLALLRRWAQRRRRPPVLLFEVPDLARILDEVAFWDLFYEHCSYFTADTLRRAFELAGFDVEDLRLVYDGQYLVLAARPRPVDAPVPTPRPAALAAGVAAGERFATRVREITARCRANVEHLAAEGPVVLWGGGSKAVAFLTVLGVEDLVEAVVDVNPHKQGKYLIGTGHPVVGPEYLVGRPDRQVVVMNPVYLAEIATMLDGLGAPAVLRSANDLLSDDIEGFAG